MAAKSTQTAVNGKNTFTLTDEEMTTALTSQRGRKATDSEYLEDVRNAMNNPTVIGENGLESGEIHGIRLTESVKAPWVQAQLRKAAKQLGIPDRITVLDRSGNPTPDKPHGFMVYYVKPTDAVEVSE